MLTLRFVVHLTLRQPETLARSVFKLLGLALRVPDRSTLSRRGRAFLLSAMTQLDAGLNVGLNRYAPNLQLHTGISHWF